MTDFSSVIFKQVAKRRWLRRILTILAIVALFWSSYHAYQWILPSAPAIYKIGMDATWYPLSLYGKEPSITAFSSDVMSLVARNQKIRVELVRTGPKRLKELLDDEYVDGILTSLLPDAHTEANYYFSDPYYRYGAVLIVQSNFNFNSLMELPKKRIAVQRGSSITFRVKLDPTVSIIAFDSPLRAFDALVNGDVDGVIVDHLLSYFYFGSLYRGKIKVVTPPLTNEGLRLVTLQESYTEDLIEKFNAGLKNIKETGMYDKLLKKWDLFNPESLTN